MMLFKEICLGFLMFLSCLAAANAASFIKALF